ncbi:hypothetical protein GWI33_000454, partial [Rhynchophorus ferrugineus]
CHPETSFRLWLPLTLRPPRSNAAAPATSTHRSGTEGGTRSRAPPRFPYGRERGNRWIGRCCSVSTPSAGLWGVGVPGG